MVAHGQLCPFVPTPRWQDPQNLVTAWKDRLDVLCLEGSGRVMMLSAHFCHGPVSPGMLARPVWHIYGKPCAPYDGTSIQLQYTTHLLDSHQLPVVGSHKPAAALTLPRPASAVKRAPRRRAGRQRPPPPCCAGSPSWRPGSGSACTPRSAAGAASPWAAALPRRRSVRSLL